MNATSHALTCIALATAAASAFAQPGADSYASGILHQPLGAATLGPIDGRRLPVANIGSSGQDGVEVKLRSAWGGGVGVDISPLYGPTPGGQVRIRPKGWDGTIKGNVRASSGPGGVMLEADFFDIGASSSHYTEYDQLGNPVASGVFPAGGIAAPPPCVNQYMVWYMVCYITSMGPPIQFTTVWKFYCSPTPFGWLDPVSSDALRTIVIQPDLPIGSPGWDNLDSMEVTGSGVPSLDVGNANLRSFPISCPPWDCFAFGSTLENERWALGQAHMSEQCTPDQQSGACDENVRRLVVSNIGSSGQDGVAIALPPTTGGVELARRKDYCCPGHTTLMRLSDEDGHEQRITTTTLDPLTGDEMITADFSDYGADGFVLTCLDAGGVVVGPPGGTAIINGGNQPVFTNRCPDGGTEKWLNTGTQGNPVWTFQGCETNNNMTLPGGTVLTGVATYTITPLNPTSSVGRLRHVVITKNGSELELRGIVISPPPPTCGNPDFDGDGDQGTDLDIEAFFACLGGDCCLACGSPDFDGDGDTGTDLDIEAFFRVLGGGNC